MDIKKFKELGTEWKKMDEVYDNLIQELIDAPEPTLLTSQKIDELKKMQSQLYALEVELLEVLQDK